MTSLDDFQRGSSPSAAKAQTNQRSCDAIAHIGRNGTLIASRLFPAKVAAAIDVVAAERCSAER